MGEQKKGTHGKQYLSLARARAKDGRMRRSTLTITTSSLKAAMAMVIWLPWTQGNRYDEVEWLNHGTLTRVECESNKGLS